MHKVQCNTAEWAKIKLQMGSGGGGVLWSYCGLNGINGTTFMCLCP